MVVRPIPEGYHTITPYLYVKGAAGFIDFVKRAFGAEQRGMMPNPDGSVAHAEVKVGDSIMMLSDGEARPVTLFVYVEDVDAAYKTALQAGAVSETEPVNQFWGDRYSAVKDGWGNTWQIATRLEEVSMEEMQRRMAAMGRPPA